MKDECKRCGMCCTCLPNWKDLSNLDRAMMRTFDREAELCFKNVVNGICPNLSFEKGKAVCLIYDNRYNFCKALKPCGNECKIARGLKT